MPISFVWLYMFKCDVCVLNHMWIKPKRFLFFLFAFGSDFYHPCFSNCVKNMFLSVFMTYFMCKLSWELNGPILKFFSFTQRVSWLFRDCFASKAYQLNTSEISWDSNQRNYQWKFPNQLLKGISWNICFKLLTSSLKSLF